MIHALIVGVIARRNDKIVTFVEASINLDVVSTAYFVGCSMIADAVAFTVVVASLVKRLSCCEHHTLNACRV